MVASLMELIPAIDLLGGKVVRLARGDYDAVTDYGDDPVAVALGWQAQGATRLHLVDLEAARDGTRSQADRHRAHRGGGGHPVPGRRWHPRCRRSPPPCWTGEWTGSSWARPSIRDPDLGRTLVVAGAPRRIVAAVDVRDGRAVGDGWTSGAAGAPAMDLIVRLRAAGVALFAVTAIARDGLLDGPDMDLLAEAARRSRRPGPRHRVGGRVQPRRHPRAGGGWLRRRHPGTCPVRGPHRPRRGTGADAPVIQTT